MTLIDYSNSAWSIAPAVLALVLAIATRRVILSLSAGILAGAIMLVGLRPINTVTYLVNSVVSLAYKGESFNWNTINIVIFLLLLGILTALLSESGSNQAFANWATKHIKSRRGAKLMAASLVFITFIDDYFHSLAVGAIARPVTDKFHVSRAKLAYTLDSTAAPMCVLMPVSSWGAYIITLISGLLASYAITSYTPMGAFIMMSSMNYYALFSIVMVFIVAYFSFDIGPMVKYEREAATQVDENNELETTRGHVRNLILPIIALLLVTITAMILTGTFALHEAGKPFTLLGAFENTTVGISLVIGGSCSVLTATICVFKDKLVNKRIYWKAWGLGIRSMSGAILILIFAWTINNVVSDMKTGVYLSHLISSSLPIAVIPALLFLLSAIMAFCTGTSWGTFGIMLPIGAAIAATASVELMIPCLSAVMAGAVCGDHCSPISDTTILSSTGARCDHMVHVMTQLPYAATVAFASFMGYLAIGYAVIETHSTLGIASALGFSTTAAVMIGIILLLKKRD
ncbi:Na+/H+ antiporter NhaC family protein [Actinobacillus delphinicola]|uniref:Na+/H+ antiporter n=1 Tax=Actinobacillus delphinicola TaxID=51161 RepID=A0A448TUH3_9PAST|nr:Na+/H+ antiporter NhaC family protein [Actinobacillus delphinicola]VEJ09565.1 Na+/H+ antiporter [Actinobacillus delphinicola]